MLSLTALIKEMLFNINSTTLFHHSLHLELMVYNSNSLTIKEKIMDAYLSHLSYDLIFIILYCINHQLNIIIQNYEIHGSNFQIVIRLVYYIQTNNYQDKAVFWMKARLVYVNDFMTLMDIKSALNTRSHFNQNPWFESYFDQLMSLKNQKQPLFAIGYKQNDPKHICAVYSIHVQYKLTRQLCKCAHIEELYVCPHITSQQLQNFQKDLISQVDCYKFVALGIQENQTLKANQKLMVIENKPSL